MKPTHYNVYADRVSTPSAVCCLVESHGQPMTRDAARVTCPACLAFLATVTINRVTHG